MAIRCCILLIKKLYPVLVELRKRNKKYLLKFTSAAATYEANTATTIDINNKSFISTVCYFAISRRLSQSYENFRINISRPAIAWFIQIKVIFNKFMFVLNNGAVLIEIANLTKCHNIYAIRLSMACVHKPSNSKKRSL